MADSFSNPSVELHFERVNPDATDHVHDNIDDQDHHDHKPQVRVSLHPHLQPRGILVLPAGYHRRHRRRRRFHVALLPMIAGIDVGPETKRVIFDAPTEEAIRDMAGLFEAGEDKFHVRVTAKVNVSTDVTVDEDEGFDGMVPAAVAAIEALERVGIGEVIIESDQRQCLICLEDFVGENIESCRLGMLFMGIVYVSG